MAPGRIVRLVPSLTETLFVLGVGSRVVGRTRYCTEPPRVVGEIPKAGGTKKVDVIRVLSLEPDLVVALREENAREAVEALSEAGVPVFLGAPETVAGALGMLAVSRWLGGDIACGRGVRSHRAGAQPFGWRDRVGLSGVCPNMEGSVHECRLRHLRPQRFVDVRRRERVLRAGALSSRDTRGGRGGAARVVLLPDKPYPFSAEDLPELCTPVTNLRSSS